ncbi:AAA family ATPase, partial [Pontibacter beigongshangensis]|uniref:AAA family ATPase n=1 Tax=Pontibacter beigongshangensis TaxID=2574733 RepID=UPI00164FE6AC
MITQIRELKKVGIFKNHIAPTSLPEYKKYNLIYGWNGSGKSTLSRIFSCIGQQSLMDHFPDSKAKITLSDGMELNETNIHLSDLNIKVFNQAFIDKNIDWKGKLNSILYVSEEKIETKNELDETKKKCKEKKAKHDEISLKIDQKKDEKEKFLKSSAKSIKTIFQAIETTDQRFLSYNKAHFEKLIGSEYEVLSSKEVFLDKEEFNRIKNAIKPQQKSEINTITVEVNTQIYIGAEASIKEIIEASVVSKAINRLLEFPKLNEWVSQGLELHKTLDSETCEYCGSTISDERLQQLEEHFNKDYESLITRIHKATSWIDSQELPVTSLPNSDEFYEEFLASYNEKHDKLIEYHRKYKKVLEQWKSILTKKLQNPFRKIEESVSSVEDLLSNIMNTVNGINKVIGAHNLKTQNFEKHLSVNKKRLERHLVAEQMKTFNFSKFKVESDSLSKDFKEASQKLTELKIKESSLEKELLNEAIAVEEFNENIHKFLGRNDLSLYFDTKHKGYKIVRGSNT